MNSMLHFIELNFIYFIYPYYTRNAGVSLKMTINNRDTHPNSLPHVPLWGGSTVYNGKVVTLRNTCPIDNHPNMLHFICTFYSTIVQAEKDFFYQRILGVHQYFKPGEFVLDKLHWLELFPQSVDLRQPLIDIFGNEFNFFIPAMS